MKISVLSPRGHLPSIKQTPIAPRLESLNGKTIYLVDVRWPYTNYLLEELRDNLSRRFPAANFVLKKKAGSYGEDDPELWTEIQQHGDAAIVGVGH